MSKLRPAALFAVLWLLSATAAFAQNPAVCPWFTRGSAENVLGGPVQASAKSGDFFEGTCRFSRQEADTIRTLDISIGKVDTHPCQANGTPVKALGNEAVQCHSAGASQHPADIISGRVRDAYFVITLTGVPGASVQPEEGKSPPDSYRASLLERIAEQVVGNLF